MTGLPLVGRAAELRPSHQSAMVHVRADSVEDLGDRHVRAIEVHHGVLLQWNEERRILGAVSPSLALHGVIY